MTENDSEESALDHVGPWRMVTMLWHERRNDPDFDGQREMLNEGIYHEPTPIDCVNAELYEIKGGKSPWELAYVDEIEQVTIDD